MGRLRAPCLPVAVFYVYLSCYSYYMLGMSPTESRKRHEEKQAKAQELREKHLTDKADRLRELSKKVGKHTLSQSGRHLDIKTPKNHISLWGIS